MDSILENKFLDNTARFKNIYSDE